jgi:hypothetical protein
VIALLGALLFLAAAAGLWAAERFREVDADVQSFLDSLEERR